MLPYFQPPLTGRCISDLGVPPWKESRKIKTAALLGLDVPPELSPPLPAIKVLLSLRRMSMMSLGMSQYSGLRDLNQRNQKTRGKKVAEQTEVMFLPFYKNKE